MSLKGMPCFWFLPKVGLLRFYKEGSPTTEMFALVFDDNFLMHYLLYFILKFVVVGYGTAWL
jgi:hypothetical protein